MIITFNFPVSDFLNNVKVLSMYRASTENTENRNPDDTNLTNNDESFLKKYLKVGSVSIADVLSGYIQNLYDADTELEPYEFDVTYGLLENQLVYRINMPETFNKGALHAMDEAIKDALENYMLYRTAKHRAIEFQSYQVDWENALKTIRSSLNRRTAAVTRNLNAF